MRYQDLRGQCRRQASCSEVDHHS